MARDWRKVAMAVLAASALASVYALDSHAQATKQPRKAAKAAEQPPPAEQPSDENNQDPQAISDLTSALWLKGGLAVTERVDATKQRSAAYRDAGVTETGEPVAATPGGKDKQAQTKSRGFATAQEDTGAENQQGGNWFKDL